MSNNKITPQTPPRPATDSKNGNGGRMPATQSNPPPPPKK
jgi:hypothetical protein